MSKKADLAEEICRIDGFDKVASTTPRIDVGGVVQSNMVKLKSEARNFFSSVGFSKNTLSIPIVVRKFMTTSCIG